MNLKELEIAFKQQYKCDQPVYTNYMLIEMSNGTVLYISTCAGHKTMEKAMICHDSATTPNVKVIGAGDVEGVARNVIVKETHIIEFLEE